MLMKKIFSFIVALALVMSASAVPFVTNPEKGQPLQRVSTQKVRIETAGKVQVKKFAKLPARSAQVQGRKHVAAALSSTITLDFPALKYSDYTASEGWWQMYGSNDAGYSVSFSPVSTTTAAGTYDMSAMDPDYTYLHDGTGYIDFTAGTVVLSFDATGKAQLTANMTGDDGNTYVITAQEKVKTVSTNVITLAYADGKLNVTTTNDDPYFLLLETSSGYEMYQSDYTQASLDAEADSWIYTAANYNMLAAMTFSGNQLIDLADYYANVFGGELEEGNYVVLAAPIDMDERNGSTAYAKFDFVPAPFVPTGETINVVFNKPVKMKYYTSDSDWYIRSEREGLYSATLDLVSTDNQSPVGTYEEADFLLNYTVVVVYPDSAATSGTRLKAKSAEAIVTEAGDTITFEANVLASDGNVYAIQMFFAKPVALYEATIEAENLAIEADWLGVAAVASDSLYGVSLSLSPATGATDYSGEYTIGENASGTIEILADEAIIEVYSGWFIIDVDSAGQYTLEGELLCFDNTQYTLALSYVLPGQTRSETITITDAQLGLFDGAWQAVGYSADKSRYVSFAAYADAVSGTYAKNNLVLDYSFIAELGADTSYYSLLTANLTVVYNETDSTLTITGTVLAQNEDDATDVPFYTINMRGKAIDGGSSSSHLTYDAEDTDFIVDFASYDLDTDYLQYGVIYVDATNSANQFVGLEVFVPNGATTLAAGVYPINNSQAPQTVSASTGVNSNNQLTYSLAGSTTADGYVAVPLWFMVSGTVTVNTNGSIVIDALNSYGRAIQCTLGAWSAVDQISADASASKRIVNGMLLIERNGEVYNAQGIRQ